MSKGDIDVYLVYTPGDRPAAAAVARNLEDRGYAVWWDLQIPPQARHRPMVDAVIKTARKTVVIWSRAAVNSEWTTYRAERAEHFAKLEAAEAGRRRRAAAAKAANDRQEEPAGKDLLKLEPPETVEIAVTGKGSAGPNAIGYEPQSAGTALTQAGDAQEGVVGGVVAPPIDGAAPLAPVVHATLRSGILRRLPPSVDRKRVHDLSKWWERPAHVTAFVDALASDLGAPTGDAERLRDDAADFLAALEPDQIAPLAAYRRGAPGAPVPLFKEAADRRIEALLRRDEAAGPTTPMAVAAPAAGGTKERRGVSGAYAGFSALFLAVLAALLGVTVAALDASCQAPYGSLVRGLSPAQCQLAQTELAPVEALARAEGRLESLAERQERADAGFDEAQQALMQVSFEVKSLEDRLAVARDNGDDRVVAAVSEEIDALTRRVERIERLLERASQTSSGANSDLSELEAEIDALRRQMRERERAVDAALGDLELDVAALSEHLELVNYNPIALAGLDAERFVNVFAVSGNAVGNFQACLQSLDNSRFDPVLLDGMFGRLTQRALDQYLADATVEGEAQALRPVAARLAAFHLLIDCAESGDFEEFQWGLTQLFPQDA